MNYLEKVFKKNSDIAVRQINNEFILVPICNTVENVNCIYTLNEVSGRIWELIDGRREVKKIKDKLLKEYEVTPKKLEKDIIETMKQFEKKNCILEISE